MSDCPHGGLNSTQRGQVRELVDDKFATHSCNDTFRQLFNQLHLKNEVRQLADSTVPPICENWVRANMEARAHLYSSNYMRDNFLSYFRKYVSENGEINGFIK